MMKSTPMKFFGEQGRIREDGRFIHDLRLYEVKSPAESRYPWDYYKQIAVIPGDEASAVWKTASARWSRRRNECLAAVTVTRWPPYHRPDQANHLFGDLFWCQRSRGAIPIEDPGGHTRNRLGRNGYVRDLEISAIDALPEKFRECGVKPLPVAGEVAECRFGEMFFFPEIYRKVDAALNDAKAQVANQ